MSPLRNRIAYLLLNHTAVSRPGHPATDCACGRLGPGQSWGLHVADLIGDLPANRPVGGGVR